MQQQASSPGVVVHDKQREPDVRKELFPPIPTAVELQMDASIAEAPGGFASR